MRLVYVAGPYRAPTPWEVEQHIRAAEQAGLSIAKLGAVPIIPHTMYRYFAGSLPEAFVMSGLLDLLGRCDAAFFLDGWQRSQGATIEHTHAMRRGVLRFFSLGALEGWLQATEVHVDGAR